jgi:hypothetical protein
MLIYKKASSLCGLFFFSKHGGNDFLPKIKITFQNNKRSLLTHAVCDLLTCSRCRRTWTRWSKAPRTWTVRIPCCNILCSSNKCSAVPVPMSSVPMACRTGSRTPRKTGTRDKLVYDNPVTKLTSITCRTFSSSPGVFPVESSGPSIVVPFLSAALVSLRRLPSDGSVLPACSVQYAYVHSKHSNVLIWLWITGTNKKIHYVIVLPVDIRRDTSWR